jgi:hypothetical protein
LYDIFLVVPSVILSFDIFVKKSSCHDLVVLSLWLNYSWLASLVIILQILLLEVCSSYVLLVAFMPCCGTLDCNESRRFLMEA